MLSRNDPAAKNSPLTCDRRRGGRRRAIFYVISISPKCRVKRPETTTRPNDHFIGGLSLLAEPAPHHALAGERAALLRCILVRIPMFGWPLATAIRTTLYGLESRSPKAFLRPTSRSLDSQFTPDCGGLDNSRVAFPARMPGPELLSLTLTGAVSAGVPRFRGKATRHVGSLVVEWKVWIRQPDDTAAEQGP